ncbi:hypothetical protein [Limosilactobacillus vaginalis]|uniref:hypothetical protein n=1 Tax=Limosilactobacillus vaginalis TaxID=1633 RepID=UPI0022E16FFC|nr:hypothetical protein [Limosilactobacillus vaginalis]
MCNTSYLLQDNYTNFDNQWQINILAPSRESAVRHSSIIRHRVPHSWVAIAGSISKLSRFF